MATVWEWENGEMEGQMVTPRFLVKGRLWGRWQGCQPGQDYPQKSVFWREHLEVVGAMRVLCALGYLGRGLLHSQNLGLTLRKEGRAGGRALVIIITDKYLWKYHNLATRDNLYAYKHLKYIFIHIHMCLYANMCFINANVKGLHILGQ